MANIKKTKYECHLDKMWIYSRDSKNNLNSFIVSYIMDSNPPSIGIYKVDFNNSKSFTLLQELSYSHKNQITDDEIKKVAINFKQSLIDKGFEILPSLFER